MSILPTFVSLIRHVVVPSTSARSNPTNVQSSTPKPTVYPGLTGWLKVKSGAYLNILLDCLSSADWCWQISARRTRWRWTTLECWCCLRRWCRKKERTPISNIPYAQPWKGMIISSYSAIGTRWVKACNLFDINNSILKSIYRWAYNVFLASISVCFSFGRCFSYDSKVNRMFKIISQEKHSRFNNYSL